MATHCLHCDQLVSNAARAEGWCENCGKKLPPRPVQDEAPAQPAKPSFLGTLAILLLLLAPLGLSIWVIKDTFDLQRFTGELVIGAFVVVIGTGLGLLIRRLLGKK